MPERLARRWRTVIILMCAAASLWAVFHLTSRSLERQAIWTDYALFHAAVNRWMVGLPMYGLGIPLVRCAEGHGERQLQSAAVPSPRLAIRASRVATGPAAVAGVEHPGGPLVGGDRGPHAPSRWSVAAGDVDRRDPAQQRGAVEHVVVRSDFTHPGGSRDAGVARAASGPVSGSGHVDWGRGERQAVPPDCVSLPVARAPVARRRCGAVLRGRRASPLAWRCSAPPRWRSGSTQRGGQAGRRTSTTHPSRDTWRG